MPRKRVVYGNANYADLVQKNGYFVDKTPYIAKLELVEIRSICDRAVLANPPSVRCSTTTMI
ncbi:MAG: hypothetical protein R3C14_49755 [Caldilineaceae bacterium]